VNLHAWFHRDPNGSGIPLDATMPRLAGADFPSLGITLDWDDDLQSGLARDYVNWLAPRLLLLQHIGDEERAWLETAAIRQAVAIDEVFALLPRVIDANGIEAARVEATLRAANRSAEDARP
jgi:hypothetical protein